MKAIGDVGITVLTVAERKPPFLAELARMPRYRPIGLISSPARALEAIRRHLPDVLLVDIARVQQLEDVAAVFRVFEDLAVVLVSDLPIELVLLAGLGTGARGFVKKPVNEGLLRQALSAVAAGHTYVDPRCAHWLVEVALHGRNARTGNPLSPRQAQVVRLAGAGLTNDEIGRIMHLSAETVKSHLREAMRRLGVHDRLGAAALIEVDRKEDA